MSLTEFGQRDMLDAVSMNQMEVNAETEGGSHVHNSQKKEPVVKHSSIEQTEREENKRYPRSMERY